MSKSERPENSEDTTGRQSSRSTDNEHSFGEDAAEWFAASTLRVGLALVGIVLLLFALGQVAGLDLLGLVVDALTSSIGRWLLVALFALLLIAIAVRGFGPFAEQE